jgi:hypothetical protein
LAHQQELLEQAIKHFQQRAAAHPDGFSRRARLIYAGGSKLSTLSEKSLDVAAVTVQTAGLRFDKTKERLLRAFMGRPRPGYTTTSGTTWWSRHGTGTGRCGARRWSSPPAQSTPTRSPNSSRRSGRRCGPFTAGWRAPPRGTRVVPLRARRGGAGVSGDAHRGHRPA